MEDVDTSHSPLRCSCKKHISLLIPCYNESASLNHLHAALVELFESHQEYRWSAVMVNDGSSDNTSDLLHEIAEKDSRFYYIDLSRNFGKELAMLAGLDYVPGDCAIIMDADLQHPTSAIPSMIKEWEAGYEDVYGKRLSRGKESLLRKVFSHTFYYFLQKSARYNILPNVGDFRLLDRKCIDALKQLRETERYTKGLYAWIGFKKTFVEFETQERVAGESHMSFRSLFKLAVDGITCFTVAPLRWSIYVGLIISSLSFMYMFYIIVKTCTYGEPVAGYPTLLCVSIFMGGIQLLFLGIIGEYLGIIFNEIKRRPPYVISQHNLTRI